MTVMKPRTKIVTALIGAVVFGVGGYFAAHSRGHFQKSIGSILNSDALAQSLPTHHTGETKGGGVVVELCDGVTKMEVPGLKPGQAMTHEQALAVTRSLMADWSSKHPDQHWEMAQGRPESESGEWTDETNSPEQTPAPAPLPTFPVPGIVNSPGPHPTPVVIEEPEEEEETPLPTPAVRRTRRPRPPTPVATRTPIASAAPIATKTAAPTAAPTATPKPATQAATPTIAPTAIPSPTSTLTNTPNPTVTPTPKPSPVATSTRTLKPTSTSTMTGTPTAKPTRTATPTSTPTPTPTRTATNTPTRKPTPIATATIALEVRKRTLPGPGVKNLPIQQGDTYASFNQRDVKIWQANTDRFVQEGKEIFHDANKLGGTIGVSCDMCHPDASNTHPETYPKYQVQLQRVALLRDMIEWCIENPVKGKTMDPNDERLRAIEAYILAQRKGVPLEYGKH
jgi:hypothetical protein